MRVVNKFPALLLRSPLHGLIIGSVLLITFNGRKSGKKYTTPITCLREGDTVLMTTDSPWWKNLRGARDFADKGPGVRGRRGRHNRRDGGRTSPGDDAGRVPKLWQVHGGEAEYRWPDNREAIEKAARERVAARARLDDLRGR